MLVRAQSARAQLYIGVTMIGAVVVEISSLFPDCLKYRSEDLEIMAINLDERSIVCIPR